MGKNRNNIYYTLEQDMNRIMATLKEVVEYKLTDVRLSYSHVEPILVTRKSYLDVLMYKKDEYNSTGYVIQYDECTHKLLGVRWKEVRDGIEQQIQLTHEQVKYLDKYYHFSDDIEYHALCPAK